MSRTITRIFVEAILALTMLVAAGAVWQAALGQAHWLVAALPWLTASALIGGSKVAPAGWLRRTRSRPWVAYVIAAATTAWAVAVSPAAGLVGAGGLAALAAYVEWYSKQHVPTTSFEVGSPLPEFTLTTPDGRSVSSQEFAHAPHVLVFYRGSWCPFCVAQVSALAEQYRELEQRGVRVALISPQRAGDTEELSRRFDAPMDFYVDVDGAAARALDIVQAGGTPVTYGAGTNGDTVVPTVVITRGDGEVAWVQHARDHRVRPEPSVFLEVIDREGIAVTR